MKGVYQLQQTQTSIVESFLIGPVCFGHLLFYLTGDGTVQHFNPFDSSCWQRFVAATISIIGTNRLSCDILAAPH